MTPAPPAPLEAVDPQRAEALKRKVLDRIADVKRHLVALRTAMAGFGENFDSEVFEQEFDSEEPEPLNRVKAVERGVDQLYNYMVELAAFGLEARRRAPALRRERTHAAISTRSLGCGSSRTSAPAVSSACASTGACSSTSTQPPPPPRSTRRRASSPTSCHRSSAPTASGSAAASGDRRDSRAGGGSRRENYRPGPTALRGAAAATRPAARPDETSPWLTPSSTSSCS